MTNRLLSYFTRGKELLRSVKIYEAIHERVRTIAFTREYSNAKLLVQFYSQKKNVEKKMTADELREELLKNHLHKMISVNCSMDRDDVFSFFADVSSRKGICSPIVEIEDKFLFFPQLKYSDIGLLSQICVQRFGEEKFNIVLASLS